MLADTRDNMQNRLKAIYALSSRATVCPVDLPTNVNVADLDPALVRVLCVFCTRLFRALTP